MTNRRERKSWSALLLAMIVVILAACKGETPTAPPTGGGGGGGGGQSTTPTVVLTVSNASPVIDSTVTVTATVTINGAPAPNGTAIEFSTSAGNFTDTNPPSQAVIRTTTNGVATVNLTHSSPGTARVTAVVNNVIRFIDVTFRAVQPCVPPAPGCPDDKLPVITGLSPTVGRPQGGELIRITGRNIKAPVKVLFDVGGVVPVEGFVTNVTDTFIDVLTPAVNIGAGQQLNAPVIVITEAGTANEIRHTVAGGFTFRNTTLTPVVYSLSPTSGPINGGTRVTISGEAFQAPVQVFFGAAESQVVEVDFGRIVVIAPEARATSIDGSCTQPGGCTGPVAVSVVNVGSNTRTTSPQSFRYIAKMQITTLNPLVAPATGGTNIVIDGTGFDGPLQVTVNGLLAQVLGVTGTRLTVGIPAAPSPCAPPGTIPSIFVTNTENGDFDAWGDSINETNFTYLPILPEITSVTSAAPGGTITVAVRNPGIGPLGEGSIRFTIIGRTIIPSPSLITTGTGTQNFSVTLPLTGFTFPTEACVTGGGEPGVRFTAAEVPITFTNSSTGCTAQGTVIVQPPTPNPCLTEPQPIITDPAGGCATPPNTTVSGAPTTDTITIANDTEAQPLNITSVTITGADAADFGISPTSANNIPAGGSRTFTVTFNPSTVGVKTATATFNTNSSSTPTLTVCLQATADPDPP
ncbi:MAG TPA: IPT/TIG domain-containing protein [Thermoanaerobaculia bacterium]|nr:IPT/TIG domain-containing protein [Thermoanaerobaculia bacterium]